MSTVLITGGTGLIGKALSQALVKKGYTVIILTREPGKYKAGDLNIQYAHWDIEKKIIDPHAINVSDYIVHLAGESLADKRWTKKQKEKIVSSRVDSSHLLIKYLTEIPNPVKAVVSSSAIGWYGPDENRLKDYPAFTETDPHSPDFLGETCLKWENSIEGVTTLHKRLVKLRTGIVLSTEGGALKEYLKPLRFGIAPVMGNGKQIVSWIHIDDLVKMYIDAIENENWKGVYNAVAPSAVSNKEFMKILSKVRRSFSIRIHVPSLFLKIGLGELSIELLKSTTVSADKIQEAGFEFLFPEPETAFTDLLRK
jgi:uncharacterized protein